MPIMVPLSPYIALIVSLVLLFEPPLAWNQPFGCRPVGSKHTEAYTVRVLKLIQHPAMSRFRFALSFTSRDFQHHSTRMSAARPVCLSSPLRSPCRAALICNAREVLARKDIMEQVRFLCKINRFTYGGLQQAINKKNYYILPD
eukprot:scaffold233600_cov17-Prasinocladus_malaysianus.AAC.1